VVGGPGAGLVHARVEAEVGGELAPVAEAADVADGGHERGRDDHVDRGDGHEPLDLRPGEGVGGDEPLDLRDLAVEEVDVAQARVDGLALADGELLVGQPVPALDAE